MASGDALPTVVHNERLKLTATYLNGLAIAVFAVGGFAPLLSFLSAPVAPSMVLALFIVVCFPLSVVIHLVARNALKGMRDDAD